MTKKSYILTKSKYVRALQCERAMYLDVHSPHLARYAPETLQRFRQGRAFERTFKDTFPNAIDISQRLGMSTSRYPALTDSLLQQEGPIELFEAGFLYDGVLVLADVVCKDPEGYLTIFEVKNATAISDTLLNDVAIQYYVITHALERLSNEQLFASPLHLKQFNLLYHDSDSNFHADDITEQACDLSADIPQRLQHFKEVLRGPEPAIAPDTSTLGHCQRPRPCPYQSHCLLPLSTSLQ